MYQGQVGRPIKKTANPSLYDKDQRPQPSRVSPDCFSSPTILNEADPKSIRAIDRPSTIPLIPPDRPALLNAAADSHHRSMQFGSIHRFLTHARRKWRWPLLGIAGRE
jgi:hypothetical protein